MKKLALIFDEKEGLYEVHYYNWLFKILPLGNILTYISSGSSPEYVKTRAMQKIKGKCRIIEIFSQ